MSAENTNEEQKDQEQSCQEKPHEEENRKNPISKRVSKNGCYDKLQG